AYTMLFLLHLRGSFDVDAMAESLRRIVLRHESLRTVFAQEEGVPYAITQAGASWKMEQLAYPRKPGETLQQAAARYGADVLKEPFDLAKGPLFRACLLEIAPDEAMLTLVMHHIISDGWSTGVLVREIVANYAALAAGSALEVKPLPVQYGDYAAWQRNWLESGVLDRQMRYWRKQLQDVPAVSLFPPDKRKDANATLQGRRLKRVFSSAFTEKIERFSKAQQLTPFMVLFAAYAVLMARWSGQSDLAIGTPYANRNRAELSELIGFFVNNLVLRLSVEEGASFKDLLRRVRETTLGAFEHPDVPFDLLVRELANDRSPEHAPFFQTMFTLHNFPLQEVELPGLAVAPIELDEVIARFDVNVEVCPYKGELLVYFDFNASFYESETMEAVLDGYELVLRAMVGDPERKIATAPILSAARREELLAFGNATEVDVAEALRLPAALDRHVARTPGKIAVRAGEASLTYAELQTKVNALALRLTQAGVGKGALVPVCLRRSTELLAALLAVLRCGAAYVPLDPIYPPQRIAGILEDVAAQVLVTEESLLPLLGEYGERALVLDTLKDDVATDAHVAWPQIEDNDLAYVIFTSGSTGKPKGVEITHGALGNFLAAMQQEPGFTAEDRVLAVTTVSFDIAGLELFLPIFAGGEVAIAQAPGDLFALLKDLERFRPTLLQATPALWQMLIGSGWEGDPQMTILCGGEALTAQLANELLPRCKALWNMYGPTETTIWSSALHVQSAEGVNMPIGGPIANTTFYVLDSMREPVPIGVAGELFIGGKGVARGYFKRPELTAERFISSPFKDGERLYRTGDLVRQRRDGTLEFLGRSDFQVKLRGYRIELGEIEFALRQQPEVAEAVVMLCDVEGQKELVSYLVFKADKKITHAELRERLRERIPEYMTPATSVILESFPRLPNGKLDRSKLPALKSIEQNDGKQSYAEAENTTEVAIVQVFRRLLKKDSIGREQRFFDMGAHSLLLVQAHDILRRGVDPDLRLVSLFQYPSVAALARHIDEKKERSAELMHAGNA
ncbi:MAG TPA: amino acid adenylation domain-containing protein, partial [Acidobacteriaceae bacterium]|nr:amino acid adenylation domain-containing protein [Acidobacteriaceae bacterium]